VKISFDSPSLEKLMKDFVTAPTKAMKAVELTTLRAAGEIQRAAARNAPLRKGAAKLYPASITFDTLKSPTAITATIGPDKELPQGALGNLIEFGSIHNPPEPSLIPAWEKESHVWLGFVADAAEGSLK